MEDVHHDVTSVTIGSVERAADVLLAFGDSTDDGLGITELATRLGLSKAAVHRVLASLRSRDLITLDETTRRYFLGPAAVDSRAARSRQRQRAPARPEIFGCPVGRDSGAATLSVRAAVRASTLTR